MTDLFACKHRIAPLYYDAQLCRWAGKCPECTELVVITDEQIARGEAAPKTEDLAIQLLGLDRYVEPYR